MKNFFFKTHVVPVSVTRDSFFVLTETSEELFQAGEAAIERYLAPPRSVRDDSAETAFWHAAGYDVHKAAAALKAARISVRMLCELKPDDMKRALRELGLRVNGGFDLEVLVAGDYRDSRLARRNAEALKRGRPWMLLKPLGQTVWVGPLLRPGVTACWECLVAALRENRPFQTQLERLGDVPPVWRAALGSTVDMAYSLAATELAKWIAGGRDNPRIEGRLIAFDTITHRLESHTVRRRPDCPACGHSDVRATRLKLAKRPKKWGHRQAPLDGTWRRMSELVSPVTGIVPAVIMPRHSYEGAVEVAAASYNLPLSCLQSRTAMVGRPQGTSGKGWTAMAAQVSAVGEALERYSGIFRGDEARVEGPMDEFGDAALAPNDLLCFSEEQFRNRGAWNRRCKPIERIPEPFDVRAGIEWTPVWSLTHSAVRYVPTALCYFGYPRQADFCQADSNGCAAGNTIEEAILQGYYELVERDAASLWWYRRMVRPGVDLDSFAVPRVLLARQALAQNGRQLHVLDITSDVGVYTFAAITADARGRGIAIGLASHLDATAAVAAAVADVMWQEIVVHQPGAQVHRATRLWLRKASLGDSGHLRPGAESRALPDYPNLATADIRHDLQVCVRAAAKVGIEVLALDQSRGETGFAVARVIAPGMRHLWPRFGPGRLHAGKIIASEGAMNPISYPF